MRKSLYGAFCVALSVVSFSVSAFDCCGKDRTMVVSVELSPVLFSRQPGVVPGEAVRVLREDQQALSLKGLSRAERVEFWKTYFDYSPSSDSQDCVETFEQK